MKKDLKSYVLVLVGFSLFAAVVFRAGWGEDWVFSGSDSNIGLVAFAHSQLPESFSGVYQPGAVFGNAYVSPISVFNFGRWLLSPEVFCDAWNGFCVVLSSFFLVVYLRILGLSWFSCLFGALAGFWVGSITLAAAGHANKLGVIMLYTLALLLVEKAIRAAGHASRVALSVGAGIAVGFMLLEQQDVALLAGIFLGAYTLFRLLRPPVAAFSVWVELLLPIALAGLLMSLPTALNAYRANVKEFGVQKDSQNHWNFVTQWSMVPSELPDLIAPGYTGWSTGNPEGPYWGKIGQSPEWELTRQGFQNFRLDSLYLGLLPIIMALFGVYAALRRRRDDRVLSSIILCWAGLALIALLLSFGKYIFVYKGFYHLPLVGNIRAPIKLLHNFQVMNAIVAAYGVDQLLKRDWNWRMLVSLMLTMIVILALLGVSVDVSNFKVWSDHAHIIVRTTRMAWIYAALMGLLLLGLLLCRWKASASIVQRGCFSMLIAALAVDCLLLTRRYFKADNVAELKAGNPVINFLKEKQGDERIFLTNQSGPYNRWLMLDQNYHRLNFFNISQMPRMPQEYKDFLGASQSNPVRLWQLASCKYVIASASILADPQAKSLFKPVLFFRFALKGNELTTVGIERPETQNDQAVLEFRDYIPRFALFSDWVQVTRDRQCAILFSAQFDPTTTVVLDSEISLAATRSASGQEGARRFQRVSATTSLQDAVVQTNSDRAGILLFTQRYQPRWRASIDGKAAEVLLCNYLCMGVYVPAGKHVITFSCD